MDDVKGLFKAGNSYYPFIERAYLTLKDHPEIMPGAFNTDEFFKDYMLAKDLTQITNQINELALGLNRTLTAVLSDALASGLDIYAGVKLNKDRIPGLELVAQEMSVFFSRPKRTPAASTTTP